MFLLLKKVTLKNKKNMQRPRGKAKGTNSTKQNVFFKRISKSSGPLQVEDWKKPAAERSMIRNLDAQTSLQEIQ